MLRKTGTRFPFILVFCVIFTFWYHVLHAIEIMWICNFLKGGKNLRISSFLAFLDISQASWDCVPSRACLRYCRLVRFVLWARCKNQKPLNNNLFLYNESYTILPMSERRNWIYNESYTILAMSEWRNWIYNESYTILAMSEWRNWISNESYTILLMSERRNWIVQAWTFIIVGVNEQFCLFLK